MDLDILLYADLVVTEESLTIPHPRLAQRCFALQPLADIAPSLLHPTLGRSIAQLLAEVDNTQSVVRISKGEK
jgi:2-amino-4-hydroxy-6-hydroxymethyldihydropteridine diphosphokinase